MDCAIASLRISGNWHGLGVAIHIRVSENVTAYLRHISIFQGRRNCLVQQHLHQDLPYLCHQAFICSRFFHEVCVSKTCLRFRAENISSPVLGSGLMYWFGVILVASSPDYCLRSQLINAIYPLIYHHHQRLMVLIMLIILGKLAV